MIQQWRARFGECKCNAPNMRRMQDSIDWSLKLVEREEERSLSQARREQVRQTSALHLDMLGSISDVAVPLAAFQEQVDIDGPASLGSLSGPGTFSIDGQPRHDNDHADITRISIIPTSDEVLCDKRPYLPFNLRNSPHHLPADSTERHLDTHFRLLREDFMYSLRECCQAWQKESPAKKTSIRDRFFYNPDNFVFIYKNLTVRTITIERREGLALMVEFDDIVQLRNKSKTQRTEFWGKSKRLQHGSLICLTWTFPNGQTGLSFTTVTHRNPEEMAESPRPSIGLGILGDGDKSEILRLLLDPMSCKNVVMMQTCDSYFSYRPILQGLQNIANSEPPLLHYAVSPQTGRVGMPAYVNESTTYDLTSLLDLDKMASGALGPSVNFLKNVRLMDEDAFGEASEFLRQRSILDKAQLEAVLAALTQELVLIQGPPGTGTLGEALLYLLVCL